MTTPQTTSAADGAGMTPEGAMAELLKLAEFIEAIAGQYSERDIEESAYRAGADYAYRWCAREAWERAAGLAGQPDAAARRHASG